MSALEILQSMLADLDEVQRMFAAQRTKAYIDQARASSLRAHTISAFVPACCVDAGGAESVRLKAPAPAKCN